jgi:hypothetical protein
VASGELRIVNIVAGVRGKKRAVCYNKNGAGTDAPDHYAACPAAFPSWYLGDVVQLVRTLPCHGRGRGFESRRPRHSFQALATLTSNQLGDIRGRWI